ncbi:MAG TPA: 2-hydroxychromene-2-carboxylate isomerase [Hyphomicrobiaceae bacterium]|nr:2-hydroxychromene-2-carboxylate isomerase [Hyphomicrobiaceae bacterium]
MTTSVEFHFDFGSPNAYLAHRVIPSITARTGVRFVYHPVLLGGIFKLTNNQPPMVQFKGIRNKAEYARLETARFIKRHGIAAFRPNPHFPVNTVQIMRGAVLAGRDGFFDLYVETAFRAMWEEGRKMDDPQVIKATLIDAGIDGDRVLEGIQEQSIKDKLLADTEASVERGNFGSPTFFVDGEMYFGKDRLDDVERVIGKAG